MFDRVGQEVDSNKMISIKTEIPDRIVSFLSIIGLLGLICLPGLVLFSITGSSQSVADLAQIVIAVAAVAGILTFLSERDKSKTLAAIDLISYMREKLIPLFVAVECEAEKNHPKSFKFQEIKFEDLSVESIRRNHSAIFLAQTEIFWKSSPECRSRIVELLNLLEEFSLRVIYLEATRHKALNSAIPAFVNIVERHAVGMLYFTQIEGNGQYEGVPEVYENWKKADAVKRPIQKGESVALATEVLTEQSTAQ